MKHLDYEILVPRRNNAAEEVMMSTWCAKQWGPRWDAIDNREGLWTMFWAGPDVKPSSYRWCFDTQEHANWFALKWL